MYIFGGTLQAEGVAQAKLCKLGMTAIFKITTVTSWGITPSDIILLRGCQVRHKCTSLPSWRTIEAEHPYGNSTCVFTSLVSLSPLLLALPLFPSLSNSFSRRGISESPAQDRVSNSHKKGQVAQLGERAGKLTPSEQESPALLALCERLLLSSLHSDGDTPSSPINAPLCWMGFHQLMRCL